MSSDFVFGVLDNTHHISDPRVVGSLVEVEESWYGFNEGCLLVDLEHCLPCQSAGLFR
jgi:hypothetical protein